MLTLERAQARTPQLRPLRVPLGVTRAPPGHTDAPSGAAEPATRRPQGSERPYTANPEALAPRGPVLPSPAGTAAPKLKPGRLGHAGRGPAALSPARSRACCLAPLAGVHTPARGATAQPRAPKDVARQPLTSRLGARGCQFSLRRRRRGGAPPGGGMSSGPAPQRPSGRGGRMGCARPWRNVSFGGRLGCCGQDCLHLDSPLDVTAFLQLSWVR